MSSLDSNNFGELSIVDLDEQRKTIQSRRDELREKQDREQSRLSACRKRIAELDRNRRHGRSAATDHRLDLDREESDCRESIRRIHTEMAGLRDINKKLGHAIQARMIQNASRSEMKTTNEDILIFVGKLRDRYEGFAADHTRVSSMRLMAAEFSRELTELMRNVKQVLTL